MKRIIPIVVGGLLFAACGSESTSTGEPLIPLDDVTTEGTGPASADDASADDASPDDAGPDASADDASSDDASSDDASADDASSDDASSDDASSGDPAPGDGSSGDGSTGDGSAGDGAADDGAAGDGSAGDGAAGEPPAEEPPAEEPPAEEPPAEEPAVAPCAGHPYESVRDENCSRANYVTPVFADRLLDRMVDLYDGDTAKAKAVNSCLAQGGVPYYNADAPGGSKTSCSTKQASGANYVPLGATEQGAVLLPYPDSDPTVGTADTAIECSWLSAQVIVEQAARLSQGRPNIDGADLFSYNPQYNNCR